MLFGQIRTRACWRMSNVCKFKASQLFDLFHFLSTPMRSLKATTFKYPSCLCCKCNTILIQDLLLRFEVSIQKISVFTFIPVIRKFTTDVTFSACESRSLSQYTCKLPSFLLPCCKSTCNAVFVLVILRLQLKIFQFLRVVYFTTTDAYATPGGGLKIAARCG